MSKRRADDEYEGLEAPLLTNSNSSSRRSMRSCSSIMKLNQTAPTTAHSNDYSIYENHPTFKAWVSLYQSHDQFNGTPRSTDEVYDMALKQMFSSQRSTSTSPFQNTNVHKYNNHTIEVPFLNNGYFQLKYNPNFPFSRDPYSISVQCLDFVQDLGNYTHFKKIILKNAKILLHLETLQFEEQQGPFIGFTIECDIYSLVNPNFRVRSILTDKLLIASNVILEVPEVWVHAYSVASGYGNDARSAQLCYYWGNLEKCFAMMDQIDVAVVVRRTNMGDLNVVISDILHAYHT